MSSTCLSCCSACVEKPISTTTHRTTASDPYALEFLLPIGTITTNFDPNTQSILCGHVHANDSWHLFDGTLFGERFYAGDNTLSSGIKFLVKHHFISATYQLESSTALFLRIYAIPYDLRNVQGKLRVRKEAVLAPARRYLRALLPRITQNPESWQGRALPEITSSMISNKKDRRTLAEIYGDLQSPQVGNTQGWESITSRLLDFEDDLGGFGLRSRLYKYQRVSVTAMINRELNLNDTPDPLFISLASMRGEAFYLQPGTMEILRERPMVLASRSGVLCEELGTGKTVMILSLILATVNQISKPEESIVDERPVMTPLAFRYFPSSDCITARKRFFRGGDNTFPQQSRVPTLVELLMHHHRTAPNTTIPNTSSRLDSRKTERRRSVEAQVEQIRPWELLKSNTPFYHHYQENPTNYERAQRNESQPGPRVVYLTSATLIVVPANLLSQWDREIQKHCEYPLRVLIVRSGTAMPAANSLASDYDIILMTYKRFTAENSFKDKGKLHSWVACTCAEYSGSRVPDCRCKSPGVSPLLQIRWKRLVIDEGHVSASLSTILTPFTKQLSVERRWIVTGTPTTNLLGLSLGKKISEDTRVQEDDAKGDLFLDVEHSPTPSRSRTGTPPGEDLPQRIWNKYDREDLNKLGKMITHFIAVPQFSADSKLVQTHIMEPLLDPEGPRYGAIEVLTKVMEMIMIRHRIEDVEKDVILPPVIQEGVLLDLDPFAVKSYNAMQAAIAINAVDSERTDQDYLFHPQNADSLQLTVKNMSQLMFWSTDDRLYNIDELYKNCSKIIESAVKRNRPPGDMALLDTAYRNVKLAAEDPLWRAIQDHEDVPYRIYGIDGPIFDAWTRTSQPELTQNFQLSYLMHADRLLRIREEVVGRPLISQERIVEVGMMVSEKDRIHRQKYKDAQKDRHKLRRRSGVLNTDDNNSSLAADTAAKKAKDRGTLKEMQKELNVAMTQLEKEDGDLESPSKPPSARPSFNGSILLAKSLLGNTRVGSSASSKLNYIINEVLQHAHAEKFLIFSDSELSLAHLSEALELIQIKYLRFTTLIEPRHREQMVLTFETSETYRVFLMELKHGARGLNLISASRVIFCEPVWRADVESQAIKRAHRIGQTRPISVKTLAIRGTAEENMVNRRNALKDRQEKLPKLIEESGMRHFIANPKFLEQVPERYSVVDVPLLVTQGVTNRGSESPKRASPFRYIRAEDPIMSVPHSPNAEPPPKKRKGVRFE
ncbi:P-loop containing nucleoside triphosphate hydrolase protein [Collybia nuda]|uniref:P-loop containing nucleoside triphosphate hydrolase protein n=1 Tax=Collybia nuda TaxID=64659 RepID=A0A9P5YIQ8_9AGAR|nr:P-loop containing nucleoside triphosphate hydrolase protein [Collybia nuda]